MSAFGRYRRRVEALLISMTPAYGFALAAFTSASVTDYYHGTPAPGSTLLLLVGAFVGYALLGAASQSLTRVLTSTPLRMRGWHMLHVIPLTVVFGLAWASAYWVPWPWCWLTSGVALTLGYMGTLAATMHLSLRTVDVEAGSHSEESPGDR